jgi:glucose/arabinose dehydrogenase
MSGDRTMSARHVLWIAIVAVAILGGAALLVWVIADARTDTDRRDAAVPEAERAQRGDGRPAPGRVTEVARGLEMPWGLTFLPDGSALVSERHTARIHHIPARGGTPRLVGRIPGVQRSNEGGLLGLAASPRFARDRLVYAYVSASPSNRVVALRIARGVRQLRQVRVVLDGIVTADRHHGGRLRFGPDGNLWIGTGDAFEGERAPDRAQLNGKVLRIRPDGSVPADNPFGTPVYTSGHRNVQGLTFGPDGTAYASELGLNEWDEVNVLRPGADYGWPEAEGTNGSAGVQPIFQLPPEEASPSGIVYARGAIWMASLRGQRLWRLPVRRGRRAGRPRAYFVERYGRLRTVEQAPDGALWLLTSNTDRATLGGTSPEPGDDRILRIDLR